MERLPKLNEAIYIAICADMGSINIIKGRIIGVQEVNFSFAKYLFRVDTHAGVYYRYAMDIFGSVEEIAKNINQFVVE